MNKKEIDKWLKNTAHDKIIDFLYYDRKEDEEMSVDNIDELIDKGIISKEMIIKAFTNQIEEQIKFI